PAGMRTFHPAKGEPELVRAYAASAEQAAAAQMELLAASKGDPDKEAPPVFEPVVDVVVSRGLGLAVSKMGHVLVDAALTEGAKTFTVHANKNEFPAKQLKLDEKGGLALLVCDTELVPGRLAARKPLALGQTVYAISFALNSTKKNFSQPTVSKGIVSLLKSGGVRHFQHDAALPAQRVGGFVLGEKGDVLGIFFAPPQGDDDKNATAAAPETGLATCLRSEALADILLSVPSTAATKSATGANELERSVASLHESCVVVTARREIKRAAPGLGGGGGYSISGSGIRHNAKCRYFRADKPCGATDGQPCKVCGG
ncbi:MAG: S1 family peptidase, partial [Roseimicrobium sp.]